MTLIGVDLSGFFLFFFFFKYNLDKFVFMSKGVNTSMF